VTAPTPDGRDWYLIDEDDPRDMYALGRSLRWGPIRGLDVVDIHVALADALLEGWHLLVDEDERHEVQAMLRGASDWLDGQGGPFSVLPASSAVAWDEVKGAT